MESTSFKSKQILDFLLRCPNNVAPIERGLRRLMNSGLEKKQLTREVERSERCFRFFRNQKKQ
jgi:hypothetical protein